MGRGESGESEGKCGRRDSKTRNAQPATRNRDRPEAGSLRFPVQAAEGKHTRKAEKHQRSGGGLGDDARGADGGGAGRVGEGTAEANGGTGEVGGVFGGRAPIVPDEGVGGDSAAHHAGVAAGGRLGRGRLDEGGQLDG